MTVTFAVGDTVRVRGWRGCGRIVRFRLVAHEVDVWWWSKGRALMRTVTSDRLLPARRGDVVPSMTGAR